ncbi:EF-hand domain-containing protein [Chthonobacter rhizosphaerae]|uniref:EF-hand domain-containing protein n=1 Tax=Chthonobacter rhizosphaerae TaxID=2735553 RepID=UPI0015EE8159|nr:EF-hand domain-containing protein [Chthonobacter rhizosphaerae]
MKTLTWTALVATAFVAAMPIAHAGQGHGGGWGGHGGRHGGHGMGAMNLMERYDTNKDGKVTQEEIDAVQAQRFTTAAGANGQSMSIQQFEQLYNAEHRERMVRAFQRLDRDGDGQVTREEFDRRTAGLVARMDRDGDGALAPADRRHGEGRHGGWRGWWNGDRGEGRGPMGGGGMGPMGGPGMGPMGGPDAGPDADEGDDTP